MHADLYIKEEQVWCPQDAVCVKCLWPGMQKRHQIVRTKDDDCFMWWCCCGPAYPRC